MPITSHIPQVWTSFFLCFYLVVFVVRNRGHSFASLTRFRCPSLPELYCLLSSVSADPVKSSLSVSDVALLGGIRLAVFTSIGYFWIGSRYILSPVHVGTLSCAVTCISTLPTSSSAFPRSSSARWGSPVDPQRLWWTPIRRHPCWSRSGRRLP